MLVGLEVFTEFDYIIFLEALHPQKSLVVLELVKLLHDVLVLLLPVLDLNYHLGGL